MDSVAYVYGGLGFFSFIPLLLLYLDVRAPRKLQTVYLEAILTRLTEIGDLDRGPLRRR